MLRLIVLFVLLQATLVVGAQEPSTAISYSQSISVPLNAVQLFDRAIEAWTWTFGKEPGAKVLVKDRDTGVLEATGRLNFRSEMLTVREESMGTVQYHVTLQIHAGECRVVVTELTHTGNRTTARGGIHMGLLTRAEKPAQNVPGLGGGNKTRLYAEVKQQADTRVNTVLQAFGSRLRASVEP